MDKLFQILKPLTNISTIIVIWLLTILNFYLFFKPLKDYSTSVGLEKIPNFLDGMFYYTPDEGYELLSNLGEQGRHAYRLANYADFIIPFLLFLSLSLPNLLLTKDNKYVIIIPFLVMIIDYMENIFEKYVLEIYPKRNDYIMTLACYTGILKMIFAFLSLTILILNTIKWILKPKQQLEKKKTK